ncbi:hypothetical protein Cs7R123_57020 [Catellatospora sp. TT07R-123]|uniref:hypothetical protein n=1 Tax=Catellatospora sp. TT07R-123 TaxID=2733863 RepID=UPI001B1E141C|nr:hypothetical protein [Catellatospora sp. TT07R-123]GHJ48360.1 hypothetical protein Cs7R123_57020 [Catellatospora sp. TT07R-123]
MRRFKTLVQLSAMVAVAALPVLAMQAPAHAAGCSGSYGDSGRSYTAYGCTGYPSSFSMQARTKCTPTGGGGSVYYAYGPKVGILGSSRALCQSGYVALAGTALIFSV